MSGTVLDLGQSGPFLDILLNGNATGFTTIGIPGVRSPLRSVLETTIAPANDTNSSLTTPTQSNLNSFYFYK
ncbi:hypothetical protein WA026_000787, partial [Henosepilachna vigintioctopunctata]